MKSVMFGGKILYRIIQTDSADDATILVPESQAENSVNERKN